MAASLSLDTITSSGSTITVPTGKTLAITDDGALTIGTPPVAITTGAQAVISKTGNYPIVPGDFTGKSSLIVLVDVSAGTSTETTITLPAESAFGTCAIHVISTATHGAGNKITINNDTPDEVYTLYGKNDHCEIVSDGATAFRTGNEFVTIYGQLTLNADQSHPGATQIDCVSYFGTSLWILREDIGGWWNATDLDLDVPAGYVVRFEGSMGISEYGIGYMIRNGDAGDFMSSYYDESFHYNLCDSPGHMTFNITTATTCTFWTRNFTAAAHTMRGNAGPNYESQIRWRAERRL
jgi:hypothetical protein